MAKLFAREVFFDMVRPMFGKLTPEQVKGMEYKLDVWEVEPWSDDLRWLAYPLATAKWETGNRMVPVREGFKETDAAARKFVKDQGYAYAAVDPVTGNVFYGRGDIQMTWGENYRSASDKLGLTGTENDLYRYPEKALEPLISAACMYRGMVEGWYRASKDGRRQTLSRYFSASVNDPYTAREIINGDKTKIPNWTKGVSIGKYIANDHATFLAALKAAALAMPDPTPEPEPEPDPIEPVQVLVALTVPEGVEAVVTINGLPVE